MNDHIKFAKAKIISVHQDLFTQLSNENFVGFLDVGTKKKGTLLQD